MIAEGRRHLQAAPQTTFVPCTVTFLTVLAIKFAGERLRQRFDVAETNI